MDGFPNFPCSAVTVMHSIPVLGNTAVLKVTVLYTVGLLDTAVYLQAILMLNKLSWITIMNIISSFQL